MRPVRLSAVIVLVASALSGCGLTSSACIDYIQYETPAAMAEAADLIVVGTQTATDRTTDLYGARLLVFEVTVENVLKGEAQDGVIEVVAPPGDCFESGSTVEGELLGDAGHTEFFLLDGKSQWLTLSPFQGAEPVVSGSPLPWEPASAAD